MPDVRFDCETAWPFQDDTFAEVLASHVVEHLDDFKGFFREAWRCLSPHGELRVQVPYGGSPAAWIDVDHKRPWYPLSFAFLQANYSQSVYNPQHATWDTPYFIKSLAVRFTRHARFFIRWLSGWFFNHLDYFPHLMGEIIGVFQPIKSQEQYDRERSLYPSGVIPVTYVIYESELKGKPRLNNIDNLVVIGGCYAYFTLA